LSLGFCKVQEKSFDNEKVENEDDTNQTTMK
jgi:hypothetical protein